MKKSDFLIDLFLFASAVYFLAHLLARLMH